MNHSFRTCAGNDRCFRLRRGSASANISQMELVYSLIRLFNSPKGLNNPQKGLNNSLKGLLFPQMGLIKLWNLCLRKHWSYCCSMAPSCASIDNLKASVQAMYSARLTRTSKAVAYRHNTFKEIHDNVHKKMKKDHLPTAPQFPKVQNSQNPAATTKRKCASFAKACFASFPRDQWRNHRINSSNLIGSDCCVEFVIFWQPIAKVTIIYDCVTTFIVVHGRFPKNGYALLVPYVADHKMYKGRKSHSNLIVVHGRFSVKCNVIPVHQVLDHKIHWQWNSHSNLFQKVSHMYYMK